MNSSRFANSQPQALSTVPPQLPNYFAIEIERVREKYLRDWQIVKRARFNAAKRFERKQTASTLAFAIAGTVGFVVPFINMTLADAISGETKKVLDLVAYLTGALSVSVGLVEQAKNYPLLARRFDICGRSVNSVVRKLRNNPSPDPLQLDELVRQYETALNDCEANHDDIDREIAIAQEVVDIARSALPHSQLSRGNKAPLTEHEAVYWVVWLAPAILGLILWTVIA